MSIRNFLRSRVFAFFIACALLSLPAFSQDNGSQTQSQNENTVEGTVVSSSRHTFVVRADDNQFHLFTFDRDTTKPRSLPVGTRVRVVSNGADQAGTRQATEVVVLEHAQDRGTAQSSARSAAPLPPSVRHVENQIERESRRWRLGGRVGVGLDPELVLFGVHSQMGPVFSHNVFFRPNAEFAWGEITDMVALNLEAIYRLPGAAWRSHNWTPYFGAGPSLNFIHQSFQTHAGQGQDIQFGNFDYQTGFNVLLGFQYHSGTFFEIKTSLYSQPAPVLRLILGKNF